MKFLCSFLFLFLINLHYELGMSQNTTQGPSVVVIVSTEPVPGLGPVTGKPEPVQEPKLNSTTIAPKVTWTVTELNRTISSTVTEPSPTTTVSTEGTTTTAKSTTIEPSKTTGRTTTAAAREITTASISVITSKPSITTTSTVTVILAHTTTEPTTTAKPVTTAKADGAVLSPTPTSIPTTTLRTTVTTAPTPMTTVTPLTTLKAITTVKPAEIATPAPTVTPNTTVKPKVTIVKPVIPAKPDTPIKPVTPVKPEIPIKPVVTAITIKPTSKPDSAAPEKFNLTIVETRHEDVELPNLPNVRRTEVPVPDMLPKVFVLDTISNETTKFGSEPYKVGSVTFTPYKVLVSTVGDRGSWGKEFRCKAPSFIDEVEYGLSQGQVESLRFRCTNPESRRSVYLPEDSPAGENATVYSLRCSHWGAREVIGIHYVWEEPVGLTNIARMCRDTGNRSWATGASTSGGSRWGRQGLVCPANSRIWNGRIKGGTIDGAKFITGLMMGCYSPVPPPPGPHFLPVIGNSRLLNFGNWTDWASCPKGAFGSGLRLHYANHVRTFNTSAGVPGSKISRYLSGIQLGCLLPSARSSTFVGEAGAKNGIWTPEEKCQGLVTHFRLQLRKGMDEKVGDALEFFDKVAGVGFEAGCSSGEEWIGQAVEPKVGDWLNSTVPCGLDEAACGIRVQFSPNTEPKIGVTNVEMKCCRVQFLEPCRPAQAWAHILTLRNNTGKRQGIHFDTKWENGVQFGVLENFLEITFRTGLIGNGHPDGWATEPFETFTKGGKRFLQAYKPEGGTITLVYQLVGTCWDGTNSIRILSRRLKFVNFSIEGKYMYTDYN